MINLMFTFCININSILIYKLFFTYSNARINLKKLKNQAIKLKMITNLFSVFDPGPESEISGSLKNLKLGKIGF